MAAAVDTSNSGSSSSLLCLDAEALGIVSCFAYVL
jgi:hypothetical protein